MGIVLKWLKHGSLHYGSDCNTGPSNNFPHLGRRSVSIPSHACWLRRKAECAVDSGSWAEVSLFGGTGAFGLRPAERLGPVRESLSLSLSLCSPSVPQERPIIALGDGAV